MTSIGPTIAATLIDRTVVFDHIQPFPLKFNLQNHCERYSISTKAKDNPIEYSLQRLAEQNYSDSLEPRNSSCQPCPDSPPFEFGSQGYSQCGVPETGASNVWKLSYEAKRHLLLTVALQRCKRSLAVDTLNA
ncbi:uncharacterized protein LACBIDRAFT_318066 [Laccaria bicolor S238N-H82]|uniref:Predicted protein n=1 Tax=Laccaria bicolor (strain S238N-H82 / ATCC MYA-4686) TaxID=486041 RepID=B0D5W2_LACBS|nr:uncharacterized protein LACBIDRAFT_318066 [Laccaria bicolor S238N-H82]EDR10090.1 predicted protein [Laccaria bicolor S238N-H82]|eukprot:XP_001879475.1 predicted protein [Laccaria bicolor S238N-H82]